MSVVDGHVRGRVCDGDRYDYCVFVYDQCTYIVIPYSSSIRIVQVSGFAGIGWVRGAVDAIGPARWRQRSDARE